MDIIAGQVSSITKERSFSKFRRIPDEHIANMQLSGRHVILKKFVTYDPLYISDDDQIIVSGVDKVSFFEGYSYYNFSQKKGSSRKDYVMMLLHTMILLLLCIILTIPIYNSKFPSHGYLIKIALVATFILPFIFLYYSIVKLRAYLLIAKYLKSLENS